MNGGQEGWRRLRRFLADGGQIEIPKPTSDLDFGLPTDHRLSGRSGLLEVGGQTWEVRGWFADPEAGLRLKERIQAAEQAVIAAFDGYDGG